jgi:hypothetical protein
MSDCSRPNTLRPPYAGDCRRSSAITASKFGALAQSSNCLARWSRRLMAASSSSRPSLAFRMAVFRTRMVSS